MIQLIILASLAAALPLAAQEKDATLPISLRAFLDIVGEPAGVAGVLATPKGEQPGEAEKRDLLLNFPRRIVELWLAAEAALRANTKDEHEGAFPPALAQAIKDADEVPIKSEHLAGSLARLRKLAEAVATPGDTAEARKVTVPRAWVDDFHKERTALALRMLGAEEKAAGPPIVRRDGQPTYARQGNGNLVTVADASVPEESDVFAAPFGKGGTWNVYQVINRPVTWLEADAEARKTASPAGNMAVTGHLVSIGSYAENQFVLRLVRGIGRAWIGLNDRRIEAGSDGAGTWEWSSGEAVTFRNWLPDDPDSSSRSHEEDGVVFCTGNDPWRNGEWADYHDGTVPRLASRFPYVVEWNLNAPSLPDGAKLLPAALAGVLDGPGGDNDAWGVRVVHECKHPGTLAAALEQYRAGKGRVVEAKLATIHHHDPDAPNWRLLFPEAEPLPGERKGVDKNYVFLARGRIRVTDAGAYTFGVTHDDGFALRIKGAKWKSASGTGVVDPGDPSTLLHWWSASLGTTNGIVELSAGDYDIELVGFNGNAESYFELFSAKGEFAHRGETGEWRLVGHKSLGKIALPGVADEGWEIETLPPGGLTKRDYEAAARALDRRGVKLGERAKIVDYFDPDHGWLYEAPFSVPFPGGEPGKADKDFALRAKATLVIPADGIFQIGYHSLGGARLSIAGQEWKRIVLAGPGKGAMDIEHLEHEATAGWGNRVIGEIALKAGKYPIEYLSIHGSYLGGTHITVGIPGLPQTHLRAGAAKVIEDHDGLRLVK